MDGTSNKKVVVGVDGSEPSLRALRLAAQQAKWMAAALEVVTVWTFPEQPAPLGIAAEAAEPVTNPTC
jgi:nucleotide-binding universal stress UspA family protein